jgi:isovaleryl-CoA dehydrogenase
LVQGRYSSQRQAFGKTLHDFGQIQRFVSEGFAQMSAGRALLYQTASVICV